MSTVRRRSGERGVVTIAYAVMLLGIMGFTGLAVDVGYLQFEKRKIQAAADAAAMGALREMELGNTDTVSAGQNDSSLNGFTDGANNTTVSVGTPTSGTYANDAEAIQATVTRNIPTFFMQVFGQRGVSVSATAIARTSSSSGNIGGCIFSLNALNTNNALVVSGAGTVSSACSAVVNSTSSQAYVQSGGTSLVNLTNNAKVGVVGGWVVSGGAQLLYNGATGTPVAIQHFTDPLSAVAAPTTPVTGGVQSTDTLSIDNGHMPAGNVLNPGVYCNGIKISSLTSGTLTFNPGQYILAGGGLTVSSGSLPAQVVGSGVSFYNTTESTSWGCPKSNNAAPISITGGATVSLSAPTTGPTGSPIGILFFEDRSLSGLNNTISGNSSADFNGAMYFHGSNLSFTGASTTTLGSGYLVIVADTITVSGASNLGNDHTALANVHTLAPATTGGGLVQ